MIQVAEIEDLVSLLENKADPKLVTLVVWFIRKYGHLRATSFFRKGDSGVHGTDPCRGLDISSFLWNDKRCWAMQDEVNENWQYDPERPEKKCCLYHDVGYGWHFHLQTHPNTIYIGE